MDEIRMRVNGNEVVLEVEGSTPLLWVLRDELGLMGTKYSCGIGMCGSCTVHVDGRAVRSCILPVIEAVDTEITTIEGLAQTDHPLINAWIEADVPQCGYCQPGQIMTAAALMAENPNPSDADIDRAMDGNLCRCGTYNRIRQAIHATAQEGG